MPPNETSRLLKNCHEQQQQYTSDYNHNITTSGDGYHTIDDNNHIVYVNKDASEYEPIFCLNDYYSSLTLDELLPYKLDPWWQKLRRILLLTFWLTLLMTFLTACLLSYLESSHTTCGASSSLKTSTTSSGVLYANPTAATTLPTTIAKVLSTELLSSKLATAP